MATDLSPVSGIYFSFLQANKLRFRVASNLRSLDKSGAVQARASGYPLILFLHGFPESWYSWRHQLALLRDEPYLLVVPDMRGYGSSSQPKSMEQYTQPELARDVLEIAKSLGYQKFIVVGHDWGAQLAWSVSLLYPRNVIGVCAMSVPYAGTPKKGLLTMLQDFYGPCLGSVPRETKEKAKFHYILYHCLPKCEDEYDNHVEEFLYRIYAAGRGRDNEIGTPELDIHGPMFPSSGNAEYDKIRPLDAVAARGWWLRMPKPISLPNWLSQEDLQYYINEFKRAGFYGGIHWYRAGDRNVELMKKLLNPVNGGCGDKVLPPSLFLIGEDDALIRFYGGKERVIEHLKSNLSALTRDPIFVPKCGHWIQQECPEQVNEALVRFLRELQSKDSQTVSTKSKL